ncbi:MAG: YceI family protein [Gemmatimonadota bacterium]
MTTNSTTQDAVTTWTLDAAHTRVGFEVKHMMFAKVRGQFTDVEGTVHLAEGGPSSAQVVIRAASIDTGQAQRDDHLRSADFFDVERFPELTFAGEGTATADGSFVLAGELKIRDVARQVELTVEESGRGVDPWGQERIGYTATTVLDRRDFGLTWNQALEAGGILVGNEVKIVIDLQAVRAAS